MRAGQFWAMSSFSDSVTSGQEPDSSVEPLLLFKLCQNEARSAPVCLSVCEKKDYGKNDSPDLHELGGRIP